MKCAAMIDQILSMNQSGHPIRKIARALGVSRNTVRAYLRQAEKTPRSEPAAPESRPPKIGWATGIDWNALVVQKQRGVTSLQLYREHEPPVSYSRFCRYLKPHANLPAKPACRINHIPGERTQIDYADGVWITNRKTGTKKKCQLFCGVLPFSSRTYAEFSTDQKLASFIRSQERMWAYFGGVTPYVVIDNLRSGVSKAHRYDPVVNPTYCDYANRTGFAVLPARPYTPRDKASIEATIGVIQRDFFQRHRNTIFYGIEEANAQLRPYLDELNNKIMPDYGVSRMDRFSVEKTQLLSMPEEIYEMVEWRQAKVHPDCCIQVANALYSVPFRHCGKTVRVKIGTKIIEVFGEDTERLACHARQPKYGQSISDEHMPPSQIQASSFDIKKAKAQAESVGPHTDQLINELLSDSRPLRYLRRVQGILRLLNKDFSREALEYAATQALTFNRHQLHYIKSCAEYFRETGGKLAMVAMPRRDPNTIHLHGG